MNATVIKLGLISFFADVASEMLYPITPIFLTSVLGASMLSVGLIEGVAEAVASLLKTYSGAWSDSISRRKPFIVVGYLLGAISKPLIGFAQVWPQVLAARSIDRIGKGLRGAPRDALIADSVEPSLRGQAFGLHRGMDTLGAAVGPLLTLGLIAGQLDRIRQVFAWALVPGLISVIFALSLREPARKSIPQPLANWQNPLTSWHQLGPEFKKYLLAWGVFSLANSSDAFLLLHAKASGFSVSQVIWLYCAYNLTYALSSPYLGKLSDRISRRKLLTLGLLAFALVYSGFSRCTEAWQFSCLFLVYGLYMGATDGVGKALAADLAPAHIKGSAFGWLGTVTGLTTLIASITAGLLWDLGGPTWTFLYGSLGALTAAALLTFSLKEPN